jgi:hypothetical protein
VSPSTFILLYFYTFIRGLSWARFHECERQALKDEKRASEKWEEEVEELQKKDKREKLT